MPASYEEIVDGPAVRGDQSFVAPFSPENRIEQKKVGPARHAAEAVIGDHHFLHVGLGYQILEGRQIGLAQVAVAYVDIKAVSVPFRAGVDGKVLGAGVRLEHRRVRRPLQAADHRHAELPRQIGIFPVGLHAAPPTRVAEDVDVGCPEGEPLIPARLACSKRLAVFHPGLIAHGRKHFIDQRLVERGRHADRLGKSRGLAVARHAVQRFVPPVVGGNAQRFHGAGIVPHQVGFVFQRHAGNQLPRPVFGRRAVGAGGGYERQYNEKRKDSLSYHGAYLFNNQKFNLQLRRRRDGRPAVWFRDRGCSA